MRKWIAEANFKNWVSGLCRGIRKYVWLLVTSLRHRRPIPNWKASTKRNYRKWSGCGWGKGLVSILLKKLENACTLFNWRGISKSSRVLNCLKHVLTIERFERLSNMSRRTTRLDRRTTAASLTAANSTAAGAAEAIAHSRRIQLHSSPTSWARVSGRGLRNSSSGASH